MDSTANGEAATATRHDHSSSGLQVMAARVVKRVAEVIIWAACLLWVVFWFVSAEPQANEDRLNRNINSRFFRSDGREGYALIYQTMPFVIVAVLSFLVIELRGFLRSRNPHSMMQNHRGLRLSSICTYPLWVRSPFGVITIADTLFILGLLLVILYHFGRIDYFAFKMIDMGMAMQYYRVVSNPWLKFNYAVYYAGTAAIIPFALLWIPVSRGSPFLRLIGLPFEHAVKYHSWLSVLMMVLASVHSLGYIIFYCGTKQGYLTLGWDTTADTCSVLAGLIAWIAGLLIWATSFSFFRRRWYEFFFGVHHLYIVYTLFWLYHAVWNYHYFVIPVLLFVVDRFLRMFQSRQLVDVLSAKVLESGAIELNLARNNPDGFVFHALSTWCIQIPSLSKLQWHFFSATSTPHKEDKELSIVIKPLGAWTRKLHNQLLASIDSKSSSTRCPFSFKSRIEGPYGDESDFYLRYNTLILVGGGIGVTPILAILRDILHRLKGANGNIKGLPTTIEVYHCVRTSKELCVMNDIDPSQILPDYEKLGLNVRFHAYITSKRMEDYTDQLATHTNQGESYALDLAEWGGSHHNLAARTVLPNTPTKEPQGISSLATMGNTKWIASITISSMLGYFVLSGLSNLYIVKHPNDPFPNYNRAHMVVVCMLLGVFLFGGAVLMIWSFFINKAVQVNALSLHSNGNSTPSSPANYNGQDFYDNEANAHGKRASPWNGDLHLSYRPNWKEVFAHLSTRYKGQSVGVLVSGSESMQEDVACECRRHSTFLLPITPSNVAFEFHSVSFDF
ncbi:hypothetical protein L7F22_008360 [Adiantum nelumboides]|nr:hypothetical protein [Adiantum nelumboides]